MFLAHAGAGQSPTREEVDAVEAFAGRARRELLGIGETVRERAVETRNDLSAQEALIARLPLDGLSKPTPPKAPRGR
jgi:hypothetical protein